MRMAIPYSKTLLGPLQWYSVLIVTGILVAIWLAGREERRLGLPRDTVIDLALIVIPCGIIGARLYYVAMTWELFRDNPVSILYIWEGGIAIYGGVIGGALGAWGYARRKKLPFLKLMDMVVPGLLLAQAIGRWGNYFNMEAYGPEITNPAFQFFPLGVLIPSAGGYVWHMATFFYESLWNAAGFAALWAMRRRVREPGGMTCWYLLIYGSGRFIIERLREDSLYLGGLRVSQYLSLLLCLVAAGVLLGRAMRGNKRAMGPALACGGLWIARWAALGTPWLYALLSLTALGLGLWASRSAGRSPVRLLVPFALDAVGLLAALGMGPLGKDVGLHLHTILCSLTLPGYVAALYPWKTEPNIHGEETAPCRSEP